MLFTWGFQSSSRGCSWWSHLGIWIGLQCEGQSHGWSIVGWWCSSFFWWFGELRTFQGEWHFPCEFRVLEALKVFREMVSTLTSMDWSVKEHIACKHVFLEVTESGRCRSFMYTTKWRGPRTVPRGTQDVTWEILLAFPSKTTFWLRLVRKSRIQDRRVPRTPTWSWCSFRRRRSWWTLSNAFEKFYLFSILESFG